MTNISKLFAGAAGLAALVAVAAPAAAQGYPGYGQYPQPQQGGVIGAIINSVTGGGYGQYPQGNYGYGRASDRQLVGQCAAAAEQRLNAGYRGQGYGAYNGYNGYGANGYAQGGARVVGITNVERRNNGGLRVSGVATSGQVYANQGYDGYGQGGYGQGGYNAQAAADLRFTCRVNARGQITEVKINRNQAAYGRRY